MQEVGFPARPVDAPFAKAMTISFESDGHNVVLVNLTATDEHATKVKLEGYSATFLEAMKKAKAEARIKQDADAAKAEAQAKAERAEAHGQLHKQPDDIINAAIRKALSDTTTSSSTSPTKPSNPVTQRPGGTPNSPPSLAASRLPDGRECHRIEARSPRPST